MIAVLISPEITEVNVYTALPWKNGHLWSIFEQPVLIHRHPERKKGEAAASPVCSMVWIRLLLEFNDLFPGQITVTEVAVVGGSGIDGTA